MVTPLRYWQFWQPLDRREMPVLEWVRAHRQLGPADHVARLLTHAGEHGLIWYIVGAIAAWRDRERRGQWLAAATKIALIYLGNSLLKLVAGRKRPELGEVDTPTALSFPSSHAVTSFAAARLYGELVPPARPLLLGAAAGLTSTRLHLLVHYPTDLIAGAVIGDRAGKALK